MTSADGGGVYDVSYMGSVPLTRSVTTSLTLGLGPLQRPLLDLYVTSYLPAPSSSKWSSSSLYVARALAERRLTLTERGLIISNMDADVDAFYAMPAVIFVEAVRSLV